MVLDYYKLTGPPFGVTPDPRYLYLSPTHREALASLTHGIQSGRGFMSIIAKPGMGKTTLLFQLLQQLESSARTVFLFQTLRTPEDLLRSFLHDLGVEDHDGDIVRMHSELNEILLSESRRGKRLVLVIDEAHNLPNSVLELVRMFSNFETPSEKLMQIILAGQSQLAENLASPDLVQLRQRISIMACLKPLTLEETSFYVGHRLQVAGYDFRTHLFTKRAGVMIAEHSEGIPRNINNICFNALSVGCALKRKTIDWDVISEVLDDLDVHSIGGAPVIVCEASEPTADVSRSAPSPDESWSLQGSVPRAALVAVILIALTWVVAAGRGIGKQATTPRIAAAAKPGFIASKPLRVSVSASVSESQNSGAAGRNTPTPAYSTDTTAPDGSAETRDALMRPSTAKNPQAAEATNVTTRDDLAALWKQVRQDNTDAELALARLYLEGRVVPKNCHQAHLLLLAASRNGNKVGEALLVGDYAEHCQ